MGKEGIKIVIALVVEALPNANFRVENDENKEEILTHLSGKMRINRIKVVVGDKVKVEISPYGTTRGRIIQRL